MSIKNRSLGASQQREMLNFENYNSSIATGTSAVLAVVPYPCTVEAAQLAGFGVTNTPSCLFTINRFIPGTGGGFTSFACGTSFTLPNFGTSGMVPGSGISFIPAGATVLLATNDVIGFLMTGTSAFIGSGLCGIMVVKPIQDIKQFFGTGID